MELSTASLQWLVQGAGFELMLFASVGILLLGLDDLLLDALWLATRREDRLPGLDDLHAPRVDGRIAVFIPAWDEASVLPLMLARTLTAWRGEDVRLYIGCYPNDTATLFAISALAAREPRVRLVIGDRPGPTTKGDNLNSMWAALCADERTDNMRFAAIVLHDAEDHVHREELALYRRYLVGHAMVQIPVVPLPSAEAAWVSGHYCDEFAEAHGKELPLRSRAGAPIPSAGVGCALSRNTLTLLAIERGGQPFRADSLTEDYEIGILIGAYGLRARFVDIVGVSGERIVSRGAFPGELDTAVRQKSRWIAGIALAGWEHLGWTSGTAAGPNRWLARWMLWRDRRAPIASLVRLAAYFSVILTGIAWAGEALLGWQPRAIGDGLQLLLTFNMLLLLWRLGMRGHFTARWYGPGQAMRAMPRAFVANVVAILAARRAITLYWHMLRSGQVVWEKTAHRDSDMLHHSSPLPVSAR